MVERNFQKGDLNFAQLEVSLQHCKEQIQCIAIKSEVTNNLKHDWRKFEKYLGDFLDEDIQLANSPTKIYCLDLCLRALNTDSQKVRYLPLFQSSTQTVSQKTKRNAKRLAMSN